MRLPASRALLGAALIATLFLSVPHRTNAADNALADAAKREGTVLWYSSVDARALEKIVQRFSRVHPEINLQTLQLGSSMIPARVMTEQQSGSAIADVVSGDGFSLSQLADAGMLAPYRVPDPERFARGAIDADGMLVALYNDTTVIAFNPEKLKADGLKPPTSLADLARPEWDHKIALDSSAFNWYTGTLKTQPNAADVLKRLAANHPFLTTGHTVTVMQLAAGEFDASPTTYGYMVDAQKRRGRSVDFINPKPVVIGPVPIAIVKGAPHPNAAHVLLDWLLSKDGQQTIIDVSGRTSMRTDVKNDPRIFDQRQPYYILPPPDRASYKAGIAQYRALLGLPQ